jgi:hypothetical protein
MPPVGGVAHVGEGINFYLRLGALGNYLNSVVYFMAQGTLLFHTLPLK